MGAAGPWLSTILSLVSAVTSALPSLQLPAASTVANLSIDYRYSPLSVFVPPSPWSNPMDAAVAAAGWSLRGGDRAADGIVHFHNKTPHNATDLYSFLRANLLQYVVLIFPVSDVTAPVVEQCATMANFCAKSQHVVSAVITRMPERTEKFIGISAKNFYVGCGSSLVQYYGENHIVVVRPDGYILFLGDFVNGTQKVQQHLSSLVVDL